MTDATIEYRYGDDPMPRNPSHIVTPRYKFIVEDGWHMWACETEEVAMELAHDRINDGTFSGWVTVYKCNIAQYPDWSHGDMTVFDYEDR